jgi:hypothetical protein
MMHTVEPRRQRGSLGFRRGTQKKILASFLTQVRHFPTKWRCAVREIFDFHDSQPQQLTHHLEAMSGIQCELCVLTLIVVFV